MDALARLGALRNERGRSGDGRPEEVIARWNSQPHDAEHQALITHTLG